MKIVINVLLVGMLVFFSCKKDEKTDFQPIEAGMNGFVQKGPFMSGSSITVQELDETFTPNGKTYNTTTNDDFGSFKLKSVISSPYVEVIAQGFYFNEVTGRLSNAQLTLRALLKTSSTISANVNILTTLSDQRIINLVEKGGLSFEQAQTQAEAEILKTFGIAEGDVLGFNQMDISKEGKSNAMLLAISSIVQGYNSEAELSELISKIIIDTKEDGTLDDARILSNLTLNAKYLNLLFVRANLENRYHNLGLTVAVPAFENYAKRLVPLAVVRTIPLPDVKNVPTGVSISIQLNKPVDVSSVTANSIRLTNGSLVVPGTFTYQEGSYEIIFKPQSLLLPSTAYTLTLNDQLKGLDGLPLPGNYSTGFVTESFDIVSNLSNHYLCAGNFTDQSGNNRTALPTGVTFTQDRLNAADQAVLFNGNNNYVDIPRSLNPVNSEWSYSVWFKLSQLPSLRGGYADAILLTRQMDDGECDIYLYVDDADNMIKTGIVSSHKKLSSGVAVTTDQWVHATMTYSANALSIYVNGQLKITSYDRFSFQIPANEPFRMASMWTGFWNDGPNQGRIYGAVDDLRLYERCLNASEVKQLFDQENKGYLKSGKVPVESSGVEVQKDEGRGWH
ncbi:MAG TPA: LamG-like jellyroll fold domain-containing protein [Prolixibacteraceae bacterium]|jgi:hypothetical protein